MVAAVDRSGLYRRAGLILLAVGGFLAGALTPVLANLTMGMAVWSVWMIGFGAATFAVVALPTPVRELVFVVGFAVLGSLLVSAGMPGWLFLVSVACLMVGIVLRIFNNY